MITLDGEQIEVVDAHSHMGSEISSQCIRYPVS